MSFHFSFYWHFVLCLWTWMCLFSTFWKISSISMSSVNREISHLLSQTSAMDMKPDIPFQTQFSFLHCSDKLICFPLHCSEPCLSMTGFIGVHQHIVDYVFQLPFSAAWNNWQKLWNFHFPFYALPLISAQGREHIEISVLSSYELCLLEMARIIALNIFSLLQLQVTIVEYWLWITLIKLQIWVHLILVTHWM